MLDAELVTLLRSHYGWDATVSPLAGERDLNFLVTTGEGTYVAKIQAAADRGFLQAQNCSNYVGSWRHPHSATDFLGPEYFQRIGRALEYGKFHLGFFDDRLAMPDILGNDHREAVKNGVRVVKMDPVTILACMGMATKHLGLGSTYSTT